jgi:hypothetical protein
MGPGASREKTLEEVTQRVRRPLRRAGNPRPGSGSASVPEVTAGTAVCRHVAAILVLPIRRPVWQKAASCPGRRPPHALAEGRLMPVCFAAGVTCFCLGTQSPAKNSSGSRHTRAQDTGRPVVSQVSSESFASTAMTVVRQQVTERGRSTVLARA